MKKIIALVLFVTMLFAIVPVAGATGTGYTTNAFGVEVLKNGIWYAAQKPTNGTTNGIGVDGDIKVDVNPATATIGANEAIGENKTITIKLSGSYKKAESHWYSSNTNNPYTNVWGKVVKIPYQVTSGNDKITDVAFVDGYKNYNYINYNGELFYYLDFALTEENSEQSYYISYSNNGGRVIVKVVWTNTDNSVAKAGGPYPSIKVVGYDSNAAQYGNYTAEYNREMTWNADKKNYTPGRLVFNIAAYNRADRTAIWEAANKLTTEERDFLVDQGRFSGTILGNIVRYLEDLLSQPGGSVTGAAVVDKAFYKNGEWNYRSDFTSDRAFRQAAGWGTTIYQVITISGQKYVWTEANNTMDVRLKAIDPAGVAYPAGTVISLAKVERKINNVSGIVSYAYTEGTGSDATTVYGFDQYLGKSSKYVNVGGEPTYVIDQQNCFVLSIDGIGEFAMAAGYYRDVTDVDNAYSADDIVLLYQSQFQTFQIVFTNGKAMDLLDFQIYFKNINRTKSGITVIGDREITVDLGSKVSLPYVLDDAYAMSKDLAEAWVSSDSKIVKVTNSATGAIEATGVGKAYIYAKDATGTFQIFIVNVVNPATVVPEAPTTAYKTYVVTASNLYVRSGPGTNYKSLGKLPRGTEVDGIEVDGSVWVQVNYNGTTAYMSGKYLAEK